MANFCTKQNLITCFAISLFLTGTRLLNITLYPQIGDIFPIAREIATWANVVVLLAIMPVALHRPSAFKERIITPLALGTFLIATLLTVWGIAREDPIMISVCSTLRALTWMWFTVIAYVALMQLTPRNRITVVAAAYALQYLWIALTEQLPVDANIGIYIIATIASTLLLRSFSTQTFGLIAGSRSQADLEPANPYSFLPPTHTIFTMVLLFEMTFGFALTFNSVANMPQSVTSSGIILLALCIAVFMKPSITMDDLFNFATLLVIAGFLFVLAFAGSDIFAGIPFVQVCLMGGADVFSLLFMVLLSTLACRNITGALSLFFLYGAAHNLGIILGTTLGRVVNIGIADNHPVAMLIVAAIVLVFVIYDMAIQKRFSFEKTIEDIRPVAVAPVPEVQADRLTESCAIIVGRYRLTPRESDILELLARGHGGQAIQDKLVISRNTVKSYARGIYQKLDIHSQQELIDLVENTEGEIAAK